MALVLALPFQKASSQHATADSVVLVVHGGAGDITPQQMPAEAQAAYRAKLEEALRAGYDVLQRGGTSVEAVEAVIRLLEDSPLFNAGVGAVLTHEGTAELDASIMDGGTHAAGAVAGIRHVRNPITLARRVMERSPHVMMIGEGAEAFAREQNLPIVPNTYFQTERQRAALKRMQERERQQGSVADPRHLGTVGAVALDARGHLAAGTSTGGMMNKRFGRVGDSPIIGAGTYADDSTCAVSATGHGEYFIRGVIAHEIASMVRYRQQSIGGASRELIHGQLQRAGGTGGVIVLDTRGHAAMVFNTAGMFRGYVTRVGKVVVRFFGDE